MDTKPHPRVLELTKERKLQKVSQQEIANVIGVSKSIISRLESGKSIPNYNFIEQYANKLGYEIRLLKKQRNTQSNN